MLDRNKTDYFRKPKQTYKVKISAPTIEHGIVTQYGKDVLGAKRNLAKKLSELYGREIELDGIHFNIDWDTGNE